MNWKVLYSKIEEGNKVKITKDCDPSLSGCHGACINDYTGCIGVVKKVMESHYWVTFKPRGGCSGFIKEQLERVPD